MSRQATSEDATVGRRLLNVGFWPNGSKNKAFGESMARRVSHAGVRTKNFQFYEVRFFVAILIPKHGVGRFFAPQAGACEDNKSKSVRACENLASARRVSAQFCRFGPFEYLAISNFDLHGDEVFLDGPNIGFNAESRAIGQAHAAIRVGREPGRGYFLSQGRRF